VESCGPFVDDKSGAVRRLIAAMLTVGLSGCAWGAFGFDGSHVSSNALETGLTTSDVASLHLEWQATTQAPLGVVIGDGFVFTGDLSTNRLEAFVADGSSHCAGTPRTCTPAWTASIPYTAVSPPVFSNDKVYVSASGNGMWHLEVFDARGTTGCGGTPKVCAPLWTASWGSTTDNQVSTVVVASGRVFVNGANQPVTALDAGGTTNCTTTAPVVCSPLFTVTTSQHPAGRSATVSGDRLFVAAGDGTTAVFDATGRTGCANGVCAKLYSLATSAPISVSGSIAYATGVFATQLQAFDATGQTGCSGTPIVCQPMWTGTLSGGSFGAYPTVAGGRVFVTEEPIPAAPAPQQFEAFDAAGVQGCSGAPKVCTALWHAPIPDGGAAFELSASAHLLFMSSFAPTPSAFTATLSAFDLTGTEGCTGAPKTCTPLWSTTVATNDTVAPPAIAQGHIAVTGPTGYIKVYGLPA
jgi:hypothetical protein